LSLETRKVLDMLAEGKISAENAERLLDKLQSTPTDSGTEPEAAPAAGQNGRSFRIVVDEPGKKPVNIRMPLSFLRSGSALLGMMPKQVNECLKERGIDLAVLSGKQGDELAKMLQELLVDIDKGDGKKVRIFCE
jgi:hypothetical protein